MRTGKGVVVMQMKKIIMFHQMLPDSNDQCITITSHRTQCEQQQTKRGNNNNAQPNERRNGYQAHSGYYREIFAKKA